MPPLNETSREEVSYVKLDEIHTMKVITTIKEVEVPKYVEKIIEVPVFKEVPIDRPIYVSKELIVTDVKVDDITEHINKAIHDAVENAVRNVIATLRTDVLVKGEITFKSE